MIAYLCTCGYAAASDGELGDHWGEVFIPPDDRNALGIVHAEDAREDVGLACLCGLVVDHVGKLDDHLLSAFTPADRVGHDGRAHALAAARL